MLCGPLVRRPEGRRGSGRRWTKEISQGMQDVFRSGRACFSGRWRAPSRFIGRLATNGRPHLQPRWPSLLEPAVVLHPCSPRAGQGCMGHPGQSHVVMRPSFATIKLRRLPVSTSISSPPRALFSLLLHIRTACLAPVALLPPAPTATPFLCFVSALQRGLASPPALHPLPWRTISKLGLSPPPAFCLLPTGSPASTDHSLACLPD